MLAMVDIVDQPRRTFFGQRDLREDFDQRLAVIELADDAVVDISTMLDEAFAKGIRVLVIAGTPVAVLQTFDLVDRFESLRSEEHTSELQSLMRISYAVFCLKKKKKSTTIYTHASHS